MNDMATFHRFFLLSMCFMVIADHHVTSFNLAAVHPCRRIACTTAKRKIHNVCRMSTEVDDDMISITQDDGQDLHDVVSLNGLDVNYDEDDNEGEMSDGAEIINNKKRIECSASIMLPFSADVAFTAFSDLTRQPSWCKYLYNVEYIDSEVNDDDDNNDDDVGTSQQILRASKWTVGVKGLRFSWKARDTKIIRPHRIEWESTSGLKNIGSVVFTPDNSNSTQMKLCFIFVLPRVVSSLYRKLNIRKYTEDVMLADMLQQFRDVVIREDL
jgi:uncharacterized membrane protein